MITRSLLTLAFLAWASVAGAQVPLTQAGNATPSSGCNSPIPVATSDSASNNSGAASGSLTTTDVPAGKPVIVAINFSGPANDSFKTLVDSANNSYVIEQAACSTCGASALAYNQGVAHMPVGTSFTATTVNGLSNIWHLKGAWISCATGTADQFVKITQTSANTGWTLTTGTLSSTNETAYGYAYPQNGTTVTTGAGFTDLLNNGFNDVAYKVQLGSSSAISYSPSWTSSVISTGVLLTFLNSPGSTATFDPSNTDTSNLTLSNGNLTVTATTSGTNWGTSRGTIGHTTGKYYHECTINDSAGATSALIGAVNSSFTVTNNYLGINTNGIGVQTGNGKVWYNNTGTTGNVTMNNGDVVEVATDITDGNIWWRTNNSANWNNSSTANPATNAGGQSIGFTGTIYPAVSIFGGNFPPQINWVCNFGGSGFTGTAPSGFGNW